VTKFSQNAVWADTLQLTRAHWAALVAIAGVFNFLPVLLVNHFFPLPEIAATDPNAMAVWRLFIRETILWYGLESFVVMIGSAAMLRLVFARGGTVGGALLFAIMLLPAYSVLLVLNGILVFLGLLLLIVPGLYLWGRLIPAGAAMVAEESRKPIRMMKRSFEITRGNGWQVFGLYILVLLPGAVLIIAIQQVSGIFFILVAGQDLGKLLNEIILALLNAALSTLLTVLSAAIYRALAAPEAAGPDLSKAR
jgi:hypothetical protein